MVLCDIKEWLDAEATGVRENATAKRCVAQRFHDLYTSSITDAGFSTRAGYACQSVAGREDLALTLVRLPQWKARLCI